MKKDSITADAVTQAILQRISTGQYAPGDRIPPVRQLADEIGCSRNTVNKAYHTLCESGIIEKNETKRKGFSVIRTEQTGTKTKDQLLDYFYQHALELVWQGMAAGISSEEMLDQLQMALQDVFRQRKVKLIFFECNDHDTQEMGRQLHQVLKIAVEYNNLSHFYANPKKIFQKYDLVITTYHHLAEITSMIHQHGFPPGKVVGIDTRLTADSMLKIARFPNTKIGVVCTNYNTAHMLKHILYGYHPEWEIEALDIGSNEAVKDLAERCDHLIVTNTSADEVIALTGRIPDVVVTFEIDEQSIAFLNQRIHQIQVDHIRMLQPMVGSH